MEKEDFFKVLVNKGILEISGLDDDFNSYRIIEYQGKRFKLTLKIIEED